MSDRKTSDRILEIARQLLAADGLGAVSFDAIARRLGRSKQAVLYWFPTKYDLLAAMFLPWLEAEADVAADAVAKARTRKEAIGLFVRAVASFHLDDLDRFRMMYLVPQTTGGRVGTRTNAAIVQDVHPVTGRLYGALAERLGGEHDAARAEAVVIHSAVLGLVLMVGLGKALDDPLKQAEADLVDRLIASLTARRSPDRSGT